MSIFERLICVLNLRSRSRWYFDPHSECCKQQAVLLRICSFRLRQTSVWLCLSSASREQGCISSDLCVQVETAPEGESGSQLLRPDLSSFRRTAERTSWVMRRSERGGTPTGRVSQRPLTRHRQRQQRLSSPGAAACILRSRSRPSAALHSCTVSRLIQC